MKNVQIKIPETDEAIIALKLHLESLGQDYSRIMCKKDGRYQYENDDALEVVKKKMLRVERVIELARSWGEEDNSVATILADLKQVS